MEAGERMRWRALVSRPKIFIGRTSKRLAVHKVAARTLDIWPRETGVLAETQKRSMPDPGGLCRCVQRIIQPAVVSLF